MLVALLIIQSLMLLFAISTYGAVQQLVKIHMTFLSSVDQRRMLNKPWPDREN